MTQIVRSTYRYKRPPRRKKAVALAVPAIVTVTRRGKRFADVPGMTPEEYQRRGDAAAVTK